jgi:hypothetical protein
MVACRMFLLNPAGSKLLPIVDVRTGRDPLE